jgi:hypothetical protein
MALTREEILAAQDLRRELVPVPEWGTDAKGEPAAVYVRTITGADRDRYQLSLRPDAEGDPIDLDNFRARFLCFCICDEAGRRLFADDEGELIGGKSADALARLWVAANRLNGTDAEAVERARKNS